MCTFPFVEQNHQFIWYYVLFQYNFFIIYLTVLILSNTKYLYMLSTVSINITLKEFFLAAEKQREIKSSHIAGKPLTFVIILG